MPRKAPRRRNTRVSRRRTAMRTAGRVHAHFVQVLKVVVLPWLYEPLLHAWHCCCANGRYSPSAHSMAVQHARESDGWRGSSKRAASPPPSCPLMQRR